MSVKPLQSVEEAREKGRKGGIASGEARRRKRDIKTTLENLLTGKTNRNGQQCTRAEAIALTLIEKAEEGNIAAIKEVFDRIEGKAVAQVQADLTNSDGTLANRGAGIDLSTWTPEQIAELCQAAFTNGGE